MENNLHCYPWIPNSHFSCKVHVTLSMVIKHVHYILLFRCILLGFFSKIKKTYAYHPPWWLPLDVSVAGGMISHSVESHVPSKGAGMISLPVWPDVPSRSQREGASLCGVCFQRGCNTPVLSVDRQNL